MNQVFLPFVFFIIQYLKNSWPRNPITFVNLRLSSIHYSPSQTVMKHLSFPKNVFAYKKWLVS